ncbi:tannase/feruloyl esterase family alpha/beta hydrolase [Paraburkholderia tropica]|uniref:tannase/feruloyl esterase family alpha/beta hydrolase n=1 Tax=Paraburkholderia tropica TaxID=92647 RepID=UPI002AB73852|nr:tannase/feruloyl esterase family alpha/beta hydrolase [Paraburkholderia tropica]
MKSWFCILFANLVMVLAVIPGGAWAASGGPADLTVVKPATSCTALADVDLTAIGGKGSRITGATETTSDGIKVCSVKATLAPAINFQVLLPTGTWTQRYMQLGCGGLCGQISLTVGAADGCKVYNNVGFVMAATDMGHGGGMGNDGSWGTDPQKRIDFAYRAHHLTAEAVKKLIRTFYGQPQKYAYFNGYSDGGREALMEAMRFPGDFNGVIAGAPAMLFQVQNTLYHGWQAVSNTGDDGKVTLLSNRLAILHNAVLAACDTLDGARDGLIADPAACRFDVASITCPAGVTDTSGCLTSAEAAVVRKFYDGPIDPKTGAHLTAGQPQYGSELNWAGVYVADKADGTLASSAAALPAIRYLEFEKTHPNATLASFQFTESTLHALRHLHPFYDATNADLSAFRRAGGKLILWHGLADPHISPANTVSLHKALVAHMGQKVVDGFERLYLLPGVAHCGNGQGPSNLDLLTAMMAWVEGGVAPDAIMTRTAKAASSFGAPNFGGTDASKQASTQSATSQSTLPDMTRPVYPYPAIARYKGTGDVYDAANWEKGGPEEMVRLRDWSGSDWFGV